MAGFESLGAAARSVVKLLQAGLATAEVQGLVPGVAAKLVRTVDFDAAVGGIQRPAVSVFVHRVDFDKVTRAAYSTSLTPDGHPYLPLEMRFLVTPWAANPEDELLLLGAAMLTLERRPILSSNLLDPSGKWEPNESLQIVMEEISTEAVMRMFDSLPVDYQLSVPYIARLVKIALPKSSAELTSSVNFDFENQPGRVLVPQ
jgi:Pvc16 N-terminal domain